MRNRSPASAAWCRRAFWLSVVALVALQQYPGFWGSTTLVMDFLPAPLLYQVLVTLLAVAIWWVGTLVAWPDEGQSDATGEVADAEMSSREEES